MEAAASGWVYNLTVKDAPTEAPKLNGIAVALSTLSTLAIMLRFFVRSRTSLRLDDFAALGSLIFCIAYSAIAIYQTRWGQALDPKFFPPQNIIPFGKVQYAGGPVYCFALLGFKLSLLASYLRIAGTVQRLKIVIYFVMGIVTISQLVFAALLSFACRPIRKQWDSTVEGSCVNELASYYALAGTSIGLDILIMALPFPTIIRLRMAWKKKVAVGCILALGLFVTVTQVIRIFSISKLVSYTNSYSIISWSIIEINLGVVVCCIPSYAPLFHFAREKLSSKNRSSEYQPTGSKLQNWNKFSEYPPTQTVCSCNESQEAITPGITAKTEWKVDIEGPCRSVEEDKSINAYP